MGIVLAATHVQLEEHVAIKLLHPQVACRAGAIDRFLREARVAMKLRGEHVVRIHDLGALDNGLPFIVMEYLHGRDLASLLQHRGPLPAAEAVDCVLQACLGIAEAHLLGVVHRDLKPPNLFLTMRVDGTPCVKVLDFGISKVAREMRLGESSAFDETTPPSSALAPSETLMSGTLLELEARRAGGSAATDDPEEASLDARTAAMTATHAIMGSPRYMAPEQIRCARDVDARADIWSLGVILFELLAGVPPFDADTLDSLRRSILERHARSLRSYRDVPQALALAIETCLAKEPSERFQDVWAFATAIAPFASAEGWAAAERIARMAGGVVAERFSVSTEPSVDSTPTLRSDSPTQGGVMRDVDTPRRRRRGSALVLLLGTASVAMVLAQGLRHRTLATDETRSLATLKTCAPAFSRDDRAPPSLIALSPMRAALPPLPRAAPSVDPRRLDGGFLFDEPH